jgi:replicative DNA helicase
MPRDEGLFVIEQMIESETKRLYGRGLKAPDIAAYVRDIIGRVGFPLPEQALRRAVTRAITSEVASAGRLDFTATAYVQRLKKEVRRWDDSDKFGFGIEELDNSFGRLLPGELLVLVGAQGSMKSSLMLTGIEQYLTTNPNGTAMLFSLDMAPEVIAERLLQREMHATADRVRWHVKNETESFKCAMKKIRERYADRLLIYGAEAPTAQLMGKCERMTIDDLKNEVEAYMPSLVAVDYLTLLRKPRQSDLDCVNEVMPTLKEMAQRYGIMFLLLSQMGRASKQLQASGSLFSGSAKGGGIVEELANAQIDLFKDAPLEPYGAPRIIATVSKTRRGVAGRSFELAYDGESMSFTGQARPVRREREQKPIFKAGLF